MTNLEIDLLENKNEMMEAEKKVLETRIKRLDINIRDNKKTIETFRKG